MGLKPKLPGMGCHMSCNEENHHTFQKTWNPLWLFHNCVCYTVKIHLFIYFCIKVIPLGSFLFLNGIKNLWEMLLRRVFPDILKGRTGNSWGFLEVGISAQGCFLSLFPVQQVQKFSPGTWQCFFPVRAWSPLGPADLGDGNNYNLRNTNIKQNANYSKVCFSP